MAENANLAYYWGNNAEGYLTLAQASKTVNAIAIATGVVSGANLAMMAAGAAGGGLTTLAGEDGLGMVSSASRNRMIGNSQRALLRKFVETGEL